MKTTSYTTTKSLTSLFFWALLWLPFGSFANWNTAHQVDCKSWGPDSLKTVERLSLYKEFFKQESYKDAITYWRYVFENAPGVREYALRDGIKMYNEFIKTEKDAARKNLLIDSLMRIWDVRIQCFGENTDVVGRKGIDLLQVAPDRIDQIFTIFDRSVSLGKNETQAFLLYPYFFSSVKAQMKGTITGEKLIEIYENLAAITESNIKLGKEVEKYKGAMDKVEEAMAGTGLLTCETLLPILNEKYKQSPEDVELWKKIFSQLRTARCTDDPLFIEVTIKFNNAEPTAAKANFIARHFLKNGDNRKAIEFFNKAVEQETDNSAKADYLMEIASIYRRTDDFPSSRTYALRAAQARPGWGEPYLLIGDLYASSGSKCGPGTGFDSQVVVWPAIDMYEKAKQVDPSISSKANEKINRYAQFMPSKDDLFFRSLNTGESYKVECWINETTTIRPAKN